MRRTLNILVALVLIVVGMVLGIIAGTTIHADAAAPHREVTRSDARDVSRYVAKNYFSDMLPGSGRGYRVGTCWETKKEWRCKTFAWSRDTRCTWVTWVRAARAEDYWAEYHNLECKS